MAFNVGDTVYAEGVVLAVEDGSPFGAVLIGFPHAYGWRTEDVGVELWQPEVLLRVGFVDKPDYAKSTEGVEAS